MRDQKYKNASSLSVVVGSKVVVFVEKRFKTTIPPPLGRSLFVLDAYLFYIHEPPFKSLEPRCRLDRIQAPIFEKDSKGTSHL